MSSEFLLQSNGEKKKPNVKTKRCEMRNKTETKALPESWERPNEIF